MEGAHDPPHNFRQKLWGVETHHVVVSTYADGRIESCILSLGGVICVRIYQLVGKEEGETLGLAVGASLPPSRFSYSRFCSPYI